VGIEEWGGGLYGIPFHSGRTVSLKILPKIVFLTFFCSGAFFIANQSIENNIKGTAYKSGTLK
jgi:hypothetical protein